MIGFQLTDEQGQMRRRAQRFAEQEIRPVTAEYDRKNDASTNIHTPLIFIHGLEGSCQGFKATMLRGLFPGILRASEKAHPACPSPDLARFCRSPARARLCADRRLPRARRHCRTSGTGARPVQANIFTNLTFYAVDDDHGLRETAQAIDWPMLSR